MRRGIKIGGALETQGEGLKMLLNLVEGIGRFLDGNRCLMCIFQLIVLACGFASHGTVVYEGHEKYTHGRCGNDLQPSHMCLFFFFSVFPIVILTPHCHVCTEHPQVWQTQSQHSSLQYR